MIKKAPSSSHCSKSATFCQLTCSKRLIMKNFHSKGVLYETYNVEKIITSYESLFNFRKNSFKVVKFNFFNRKIS